MRVLIVVGAGASYDCWPDNFSHVGRERLPLANGLFSTLPKQNSLLQEYGLVGLASRLRQRTNAEGDNFDIEAELAAISDKATNAKDLNTTKDLFKSRFYIQRLIYELSADTLRQTYDHTIYIDLLNQVKIWTEESPATRFVDIVCFNYDDLLEKAMTTVYSFDWDEKTKLDPIKALYSGSNVRLYKPHGSITWGRPITSSSMQGKTLPHIYRDVKNIFGEFNTVDLIDEVKSIDPSLLANPHAEKDFVPAIAVPFKGKVDFKECPSDMFKAMVEALKDADKLITIGWKGADEHFTRLLSKENKDKLSEIVVASPSGDTLLSSSFKKIPIVEQEYTFPNFVSSKAFPLDQILSRFDKINSKAKGD